jgi:hypothetical protein
MAQIYKIATSPLLLFYNSSSSPAQRMLLYKYQFFSFSVVKVKKKLYFIRIYSVAIGVSLFSLFLF